MTLTKKIFYGISLTLIILISFVTYGLYLMDIEDRYGDFQNIYFDSKSNDIIVNNLTGEIAILKIEDRRIEVLSKGKYEEIFAWKLNDKYGSYNLDVYRSVYSPKEYLDLTLNEIKSKKMESELISVLHLEYKGR